LFIEGASFIYPIETASAVFSVTLGPLAGRPEAQKHLNPSPVADINQNAVGIRHVELAERAFGKEV
jgi:hypothetical protein